MSKSLHGVKQDLVYQGIANLMQNEGSRTRKVRGDCETIGGVDRYPGKDQADREKYKQLDLDKSREKNGKSTPG